MLKQPLFGEDSSPQITSMLISAIVTLCAWIVFCVLCLVIKFKPQTPQYKEVQIVLASTPIEEKSQSEESAAADAIPKQSTAVPEPVEGQVLPNPAETPVAEAKLEAPKEKPAPAKTQNQAKINPVPKTATKKAETPADKKVNYEIVKSVDEMMNEQMNSGKKQSQVPDWFYDDDPSEMISEPVISQKVDKVAAENVMSGTAGIGAQNSPSGKSGGGKQNDSANSNEVSDETSKYLASIAKAKPYSTKTGVIESTVTIATTTDSSGKLNIQMSDGKTRTLLNPKSPEIRLSDEAAKSIDSDIILTISFQVHKDGNVFNISFSRATQINEQIQKEITKQLSVWYFEPGSSTATASFEYTIKRQ